MHSPPETDTGPGETRGTRGELGNRLYERVCGTGGRSGGAGDSWATSWRRARRTRSGGAGCG